LPPSARITLPIISHCLPPHPSGPSRATAPGSTASNSTTGRAGTTCQACSPCAANSPATISPTTCKHPAAPPSILPSPAGRPGPASPGAAPTRTPIRPATPCTPSPANAASSPPPHLPPPYALVIPGTSASQNGAKKWPTDRYAALASGLAAAGLHPVIAGTQAEASEAATIQTACPDATDLTGRTTLQELAGLAARAAVAVGGDTGPIHLAAMMGCPVVALFSRFSNPALAAPVGEATVLCADSLNSLDVPQVQQAVLARRRAHT